MNKKPNALQYQLLDIDELDAVKEKKETKKPLKVTMSS